MRVDHSRVFGLDVLRAFAIICVVYEHGYGLLYHAISEELYNLPLFDGVTLFFVLSGFLIGRILLKTMNKSDLSAHVLLAFWVRRWFRTIPNYLLVLTFLVVVTHMSGQPRPDDLIYYYFFSQNIATPHPDFFAEAWSLTVEEWFYLVIPVLLLLSTKLRQIKQQHCVLFWIVAIIVAVTALRIYRVHQFGYVHYSDWDDALRKQVVTRLDSLMFGVLGAYLQFYRGSWWLGAANLSVVAGVGILLIDKFFFMHAQGMFYLNYFSLTLTAVGTLLLLPKLSSWQCRHVWLVRLVTWVSLISYSMYLLNYTLVQQFVLPIAMRYLMQVLWDYGDYIILIRYSMYWLITLACSFLLYCYFERPMTALRERFHSDNQKPVVARVTLSKP